MNGEAPRGTDRLRLKSQSMQTVPGSVVAPLGVREGPHQYLGVVLEVTMGPVLRAVRVVRMHLAVLRQARVCRDRQDSLLGRHRTCLGHQDNLQGLQREELQAL